ncbi:type III secretion system outer membrane ring subunit SctC [Desulfocurvus vexinensis]|uniref:type III secretion system outer membrane ring subunit SctC n=1 Tax=Desulfocurvus vexinensis TaxID=399548 RepID=UPI0004B19A38|nr:type III secretion system outer membrane ring subunit SctC [Desulfocurvus vexinensis]
MSTPFLSLLGRCLTALALCCALWAGAWAAGPDAGQASFSKSVANRYTLPISSIFKVRFSHYAEQAPLVDVLETFARTQGLRAAFTPNVKGEVSGMFSDMSPDEFLAAAYSAFGVEWYLMDDVLHFYVRRDLERRMVYLTASKPTRMRDILTRAGLLSPQLPCVADDDDRVLAFSGPAEYTEGVAAAIASYEAAFRNDQVVRVFFLKHAWADDTELGSGSDKKVIPGVATILSEMVMEQRAGDSQLALGSGAGAAVRETIPPLPEEQQILRLQDGEAAKILEELRRRAKEQMELDRRVASPLNTQTRALPASPVAELAPRILADSRSNAVIVRDSAYRMPYYEKTIAELDKPLQLVELHAAIVDVDVDYSSSLGVKWGGSGHGGPYTSTGAGVGLPSLNDTAKQVPLPADLPNALIGEGLTLSTVYSFGTDYFMAQVNALESDGKGRVLGRPSVLTIDNTSARLEASTTFYIRVVGTEVVDLREVSSGTVLDVTPHIIEYDDKPAQIKMAITVEDGGDPSTGSTTSDIPAVVKKTTIRTQGIVSEGQSLLIGGYFYEQVKDDQTGVPVLMDLPALGALFRTKTKTSQRMERLILISPRLLTLDESSNVPQELNELGFSAAPASPQFVTPGTATSVPKPGGCAVRTRDTGQDPAPASGTKWEDLP